jgi:hypothetical protein
VARKKQGGEARLVRLWPEAGQTLGYRSRSAVYAAADKKLIKTVRLGRLRKVSTVWLERKLAGAEEDGERRLNENGSLLGGQSRSEPLHTTSSGERTLSAASKPNPHTNQDPRLASRRAAGGR